MNTEDKKIIVYCDGGARNNPGPAAVGAVIKNGEKRNTANISARLLITKLNIWRLFSV